MKKKGKIIQQVTLAKYTQIVELQRVLNRHVTTFVTNSTDGWVLRWEKPESAITANYIKRVVKNYLNGLEVQAV